MPSLQYSYIRGIDAKVMSNFMRVKQTVESLQTSVTNITNPTTSYASLQGTGETSTPGALTQTGKFVVNDVDSGGIILNSPAGTIEAYIGANASTATSEINLQSNTLTLRATNVLIYPKGFGAVVISNATGAAGPVTIQDTATTWGILLTTSGTAPIVLDSSVIGFFGTSGTTRPAHPTTLTEVINALQALGLTA